MPIKADFTHQTYAHKGWPAWSPVDFTAEADPEDAHLLVAGGAAHLGTTGKYKAGVATGAMAHFLIRDPTWFDVATDAHNSYGGSGLPAGRMSSLVAAGAFELVATEFDKTKTYAPNDKLTSPTPAMITGTDKSDAGKLFKTKNWNGGGDAALAFGTDDIIGICSWGQEQGGGVGGPVTGPKFTNAYRVTSLAFWPVFSPATA